MQLIGLALSAQRDMTSKDWDFYGHGHSHSTLSKIMHSEDAPREAVQVVNDARMLKHRALGAASAAGREDDVAHVAAADGCVGRRHQLLGYGLPLAVHLQACAHNSLAQRVRHC